MKDETKKESASKPAKLNAKPTASLQELRERYKMKKYTEEEDTEVLLPKGDKKEKTNFNKNFMKNADGDNSDDDV